MRNKQKAEEIEAKQNCFFFKECELNQGGEGWVVLSATAVPANYIQLFQHDC